MDAQDLLKEVEQDFPMMEAYITEYGNVDITCGIQNVLAIWARNKRKLYKLFGNKLRVEIPVSLEADKNLLESFLRDIYSIYFEWDPDAIETEFIPQDVLQKNAFINEYYQALQEFNSDDRYVAIQDFLAPTALIKNQVLINHRYIFSYKGKNLVIDPKTKPFKAVGKIINLLGKEKFPHWKEFKDQVSTALSSKKFDGVLTFSIHPMDFITLSDNNNGWSSCVSWRHEGDYFPGTLELLNSNNAVVCYISKADNFQVVPDKDYYWNNKSWRSLAFVNKNIILAGKAYPFRSDNLSQTIVRSLAIMAKEKFNWEYRYDVQQYFDMIGFNDEYDLQNKIDRLQWDSKPAKKIFLYSNYMYNDIVNADGIPYWCVRNKVDKIKNISFSGPLVCLDCGKPMKDYPRGNSRLLCPECDTHKTCHRCGKYIHKGEKYVELLENGAHCEECAKLVKQCPDCGENFIRSTRYFISHNPEELAEIAKDYKENYRLYSTPFYYVEDLLKRYDCSEATICRHCYDEKVANKQIINTFVYGRFPFLSVDYPKDSSFVQERLVDNVMPLPEGSFDLLIMD